MRYPALIFSLLLLLWPLLARQQRPQSGPLVRVDSELSSLLADEDVDGDRRITIEDDHVEGSARGDKVFRLTASDGSRLDVTGTYYLSNLLQELSLAQEAGRELSVLDRAKIFEPPADRISRMIREVFWDGLTRTIDERGLLQIVQDQKYVSGDGIRYLYVPEADRTAVRYYTDVARRHPDWKLKVNVLSGKNSAPLVRSLDGKHGLLSLKLVETENGEFKGTPFVVPGGRFNEMYGWDSFFITIGLLKDGRADLAKSMVDNFVYEIRRYGAILNANRTYYLTRSQPPFLTSMILAVYERLPKSTSTKEWLRDALDAAIVEYESVWMNPERLTETGLSRYWDSGSGPCPEVNEYQEVFEFYAARNGMEVKEFEHGYRAGSIKDTELDEYFKHDRAMRESGHDTSYRLVDRCTDLVTVDLNSLLYKIETDIAEIISAEFGGRFERVNGLSERSDEWTRKAIKRREAMNRYLWSEEKGLYFDYNFIKGERTSFVCATTFYPLWAGQVSEAQAAKLVPAALGLLENPGGLAGSTEASRGPLGPGRPERQWDYPFGWSPHQMLAWDGLLNYGYVTEARRLAYRWLFTITVNAANYNGTVPEKFDVVGRSHKVFAEYGNVGTEFSYITREGFGWTNASFQIGMDLLTPELRASLNALVAPEWLTWTVKPKENAPLE
ncbi:MAG TPA: trehalase family glycosidase [Bacteroidota bacterium]